MMEHYAHMEILTKAKLRKSNGLYSRKSRSEAFATLAQLCKALYMEKKIF